MLIKQSRIGSAVIPKFDPISKTDPAEIERLIERLRQSNLEQRDLELVERLLQTVLSLVRLLQQKNASLKRLKRLIFGPGSDRRIGTGSDSASSPEDKKRDSQTDSNPQPGPDASSQTLQLSSNQKSKRRGHGRMASSVYTGAKIVICPHPTLKASDSCPDPYCQGRLYDTKEPAIFIQLTGQALVGATKYEQEVLRCTSCQERFTASLPAVGNRPVFVEEKKRFQDEELRGKAERNQESILLRLRFLAARAPVD